MPGPRPSVPRAVRALLLSCHPEPVAAVTAGSAALAVAAGHSAAGAARVAVAVLAGQLSIGWANDAVDAARDRAAGRADKPVVRGEIGAATVGRWALVALAVCVPLSLLSGLLAGLTHVVAVLSGWAYDLRVKATAASVVPYALSFGLLPAFVVLALPGAPFPPVWVLVAGGLIGAGAHFVNAVPDLADDEKAGVRGLPHRLGAPRSTAVAVVLLVAATAVLALGPPGRAGGVAVVAFVVVLTGLAVGVVRGRRPGSRARFRAVLVVALVDVVLLLLQGRTLA